MSNVQEVSVDFFGWYTDKIEDITGSMTLLSLKTKDSVRKILIDVGSFQSKEREWENNFIPEEFKDVEAVILTHAHLDHIGRLPVLFRKLNWNIPIYCLDITGKLIEVPLDQGLILSQNKEKEAKSISSRLGLRLNKQLAEEKRKEKAEKGSKKSKKAPKKSKKNQKKEALKRLRSGENLSQAIEDISNNAQIEKLVKKKREEVINSYEEYYNKDDVVNVLTSVESVEYGEAFNMLDEDIQAMLFSSAHTEGSAWVFLKIPLENGTEKKIFFSGDVGRGGHNSILNQELPDENIDLLIQEWTYLTNGERPRVHSEIKKEDERFLEIIHDTYKKRGKLLIPCFAFQRFQDIGEKISRWKEEGLIPEDMLLFCDGPSGKQINDIFLKNLPGRYESFLSKGIIRYITEKYDKNPALKTNKSAIIIGTGGMVGVWASMKYLPMILEGSDNALAFVWYQAKGTLGRQILNGEKLVDVDSRSIDVNCEIHKLNYSGHADHETILRTTVSVLEKTKKQTKVIINHGNLPGFKTLKEELLEKGAISEENILPATPGVTYKV